MPAILSCQQLRTSGGGVSETVEGDGPVRATYRLRYLLKTDSTLIEFQTIAAWFNANVYAAGLEYFNGLGVDLTSFASRLSGERREDMPKWWELDLEFEPRSDDEKDSEKDDGSRTDDPLEARVQIEIDDVVESVPVEKAVYRGGFVEGGGMHELVEVGDERPVCNSAGDVITDPAPETERHYTVIRVTKNFPTWDAELWRKFRGQVNNAPCSLYHPELGMEFDFQYLTLRVLSIRTSGPAFQNRTLYVPVEFAFAWLDEVGDEGQPLRDWRHYELDRGRKRSAAAGEPDGKGGTYSMADMAGGVPELAAIEDVEGNVFDDIVLLDGKGQPLAPGAEAVVLEWGKYPEADLTELFDLINYDPTEEEGEDE